MDSGHRLFEIIATGPLPTDRVVAIGAALAEIVAGAHARGKFFGALTPATVFVTDGGSVRLLDAAEAPISARRQDDLLAIGTSLYAMATGVPPYGAPPRGDRPVAPSLPPSPIDLNPRLPSGLVQLLRRGVHPDPAQRFGSAAEIGEGLREVRRAPGSLESLLPAEHVSSSAAVKPPPRPPLEARGDEEGDDAEGDVERDVEGDVETFDADADETEAGERAPGLPPFG